MTKDKCKHDIDYSFCSKCEDEVAFCTKCSELDCNHEEENDK